MTRIKQHTRDTIVSLYRQGETNKTEIARRVGVSKPTVYDVLREAGLHGNDAEDASLEADEQEPPEEPEDGELGNEDDADDYGDGDGYGDDDRDGGAYPEQPTPPSVLAALAGGIFAGAAGLLLLLKMNPSLVVSLLPVEHPYPSPPAGPDRGPNVFGGPQNPGDPGNGPR